MAKRKKNHSLDPQDAQAVPENQVAKQIVSFPLIRLPMLRDWAHSLECKETMEFIAFENGQEVRAGVIFDFCPLSLYIYNLPVPQWCHSVWALFFNIFWENYSEISQRIPKYIYIFQLKYWKFAKKKICLKVREKSTLVLFFIVFRLLRHVSRLFQGRWFWIWP